MKRACENDSGVDNSETVQISLSSCTRPELSKKQNIIFWKLEIKFDSPMITFFGETFVVERVEFTTAGYKPVIATSPPWEVELDYEEVVATGKIYFKDSSQVDFSFLLEPPQFPREQGQRNGMLMSHMVKKCYPPGKMIEYSSSKILPLPISKHILIRFTVDPRDPETITKGSVNGVPFKSCQLTKGNNIGEYNLFIESSTANLRGTWNNITFRGVWTEDNERVSVIFRILHQVLNHDHPLNYLHTNNRISEILDAIHYSVFSKIKTPFYGIYESNEDPIKEIQSSLFVDEATALEIVSVFKKLLIEHSKIAQWDSKIIEYGVETKHCKITRKSVFPVAILTLNFESHKFDPEKYRHLFRTENQKIWESLPNLQNKVLSYLEDLELRSQQAFQNRAIREYQLSKEPKYWYSYERIYFLLCCNHSKELRSLPLDVIYLICSFLPKSIYGCLNFGYQKLAKDKYKNIEVEKKYLSLLPENNTFELVTTQVGQKEITTGLWKVVTSDGRPTILFTQVKTGTMMQKDFVGVLNRDKWGKLKIDVDRRENQMNMDVDRIGRQLYTGIGQDHRDVWGLLYRRGEWGHTNTGADRRDKQFSLLEISAWHLSQIKGCNEYSINCQ